MKVMLIDNKLSSLVPATRAKVEKFIALAKSKGFIIYPFETLRTIDRQRRLVANGRSRTMNSYHLKGKAVDVVFKDAKGNPTRQGNFKALIPLGKACGLTNLAPYELCHYQDS